MAVAQVVVDLERRNGRHDGVTYTSYARDYSPPYVHQWNLSLQRQVGTDWMIAANYVGNTTIHIPSDREVNYAVYIPGASTAGNTNQRRIFYLANPTEGDPRIMQLALKYTF